MAEVSKRESIQKRIEFNLSKLPGPPHLIEDRMRRPWALHTYWADEEMTRQYVGKTKSWFEVIRKAWNGVISVKTVDAFTRSPEELEWKNR